MDVDGNACPRSRFIAEEFELELERIAPGLVRQLIEK